MARPTKYNEEMQAKADKYVSGDWEFWDGGDVMPSVEGLTDYLGIQSMKTLYNWRDTHEAFLHTLERLKRSQKRVVIKHSMNGDYNSAISKLILSANHGMVEKQQTDLTSSDGTMRPVTIEVIGVDSTDD